MLKIKTNKRISCHIADIYYFSVDQLIDMTD